VQQYEAFKAALQNGGKAKMPDLPFMLLSGLKLSDHHWQQIAENAPWNTTRMNLNTFARHNVFTHRHLVKLVAKKLRDEAAIRRSRAFPYGLLAAYTAAGEGVPGSVRQALHDAMEISVQNVPMLRRADGAPATVAVLPDVSGSMSSPVTGHRGGGTTAIRCVDVSALLAAAVSRRNPRTTILPFNHEVRHVDNKQMHRPVLESAKRLSNMLGGGTDCAAPLRWLNTHGIAPDVVLFVSDNESWIDNRPPGWRSTTAVVDEWRLIKARNPMAKMVCLDIQPYGTSQAATAADVLNLGGFSDAVWPVIDAFTRGDSTGEHWVHEIEKESL
jgi:60 kDa SS-A/Ro ribonucleoprotein